MSHPYVDFLNEFGRNAKPIRWYHFILPLSLPLTILALAIYGFVKLIGAA